MKCKFIMPIASILLILIPIQTKLHGQITLRPDLENTLKGKSNINDVWQSVNDYYFQKFADSTIDSMEIKKLKRE